MTGMIPRSSLRRAILAALACGLVGASLAQAHECWLAPATWTPEPGEVFGLSLLVGHADDVRAMPRRSDHLRRFVHRTPEGTLLGVPGTIGQSPAGVAAVSEAGPHVFAYEGNWMHSQLAAARFDAYLAEKGLESVRQQRTRRGEHDQPGVERYRRACVALLHVAASPDDSSEHEVGDAEKAANLAAAFDSLELPVVIVPLVDPASLKPGSILRVEVRAGNRPLADVQVAARPLVRDPGRTRTGRTDADGRIGFVLDRGGVWLLDAVTMQRSPDGTTAPEDHESLAGTPVDWESTWASLTFELSPNLAAGPGERGG